MGVLFRAYEICRFLFLSHLFLHFKSGQFKVNYVFWGKKNISSPAVICFGLRVSNELSKQWSTLYFVSFNQASDIIIDQFQDVHELVIG